MTAALLLLGIAAIPANGRDKDTATYGEGLIVNLPMPESEVAQVVEDVVQNTLIRGTKEYNKDEYVSGAVEATSTPVFRAWTESGKVFYKVRKEALDPRNFKNSGGLGTLAVRYVVEAQDAQHTILRIDAVFVDNMRRTTHASNGSVESAEYNDIQEHLAQIELMKKETAEAIRQKQERMAKENFGLGSDKVLLSTPPSAEVESTSGPSESDSASQSGAPAYVDQPESLPQQVADLRRQVERRVKKPGAPLQSAPFHSANTVESLDPGAEVLILISTPYWYGVETHDGQHGWIRRDELEQAP